MKNEKLEIHLVPHTHWDREWYFTSDDSRVTLYYHLRDTITELEKNKNLYFTFDGQSSIVEDFLMYSPEWKDRFTKLVKEKRLLIGPFYTQTDNVTAEGESIMRNLEIGISTAAKVGGHMNLAYMPDVFGHNNQTPQLIKMNGIDIFSFYRGHDPEKSDNTMYFTYEGLDGSQVLGHWQTHYVARTTIRKTKTEGFDETLIGQEHVPGSFNPTVKFYETINNGLPIAMTAGGDQEPYNPKLINFLDALNIKQDKYKFIVSDYWTALNKVKLEAIEKNKKFKIVRGELRCAKTGRVHRTVMSSRMDLKHTLFNLENVLINEVEPLSVLASLNGIDVPWIMIENSWKELFKSSAHDSYGATNTDEVNKKIISRNLNAINVANNVSGMISKIYASKLLDMSKKFEQLLIFNNNIYPFTGKVELTLVVDNTREKNFSLSHQGTAIPFTIVSKQEIAMHDGHQFNVIIDVNNIDAFGLVIFDITYPETPVSQMITSNVISNERFQLTIEKSTLNLFDKKTKINRENFIQFAADASIGDVYDHSPITHNDQKYIFGDFEIKENCITNGQSHIKLKAKAFVPNNIDEWTTNSPSTWQDLEIILILGKNDVSVKVFVENKANNLRLTSLIATDTIQDQWKHAQQFGVYSRKLKNEYMDEWEKPDKYGYKWDEYPTNLSAQHGWISTMNDDLNIFTQGSREHEMIEWDKKTYFAITLYRAFEKFGTQHVLYRPGRASGAKMDGPDNQLKNKLLEFDITISYEVMSDFNKFLKLREFHKRPYYIPGGKANYRMAQMFDVPIDKFDGKEQKRGFEFDFAELAKEGIIMSALYKNQFGHSVMRLLNVTNRNVSLDLSKHKFSFTHSDFLKGKKEFQLSPYKMVNILVK